MKKTKARSVRVHRL